MGGQLCVCSTYTDPQPAISYMMCITLLKKGDDQVLVDENDILWNKTLHSAEGGGPAQTHMCSFHTVHVTFQHMNDWFPVLFPSLGISLLAAIFNVLVLRPER